jgi:hypothetical protein
MPHFEPEVARRMVERSPHEGWCVELDVLIDHLIKHNVCIARIGDAIESGKLKVEQYPLLRQDEVNRWLAKGMPT